MRTYYRARDVVVTSTVFANRTATEPYVIRDLRHVCILRPPGGLVRWLRPRTFLLQATYRGTTVTLYASADQRVFNQVARALRRALEDAEPPATWDDTAAA